MIDFNKPYILVTSEKGQQTVEAVNYQGRGCISAVQEIQQMLGGSVLATQDKPEISMPSVQVAATVTNRLQ